MSGPPEKPAIVLVTGLSGAGKNSILRALEDLGFETIDNPPLAALEELAARAERNLAVGVDARSRGFSPDSVLITIQHLRREQQHEVSLVFATASDEALLRRYSETRRRHPLAQTGKVADGIALERSLTEPLSRLADLVIDTSNLPLPRLRDLINRHFSAGAPALAVSLVSFAYPSGLPPEADLVFDARFLRNPHYDPSLRPLSGMDAKVSSFVEQDPDFAAYFARISGIVEFLLPRFVQEGKKYATICVGCTGGQHRSVVMVEKLNAYLGKAGWQTSVTHREAVKFDAARNQEMLAKE